ncbi:MAG: FG-GAP-like repeat-containing protein [Planctomycetaceae bacterium]
MTPSVKRTTLVGAAVLIAAVVLVCQQFFRSVNPDVSAAQAKRLLDRRQYAEAEAEAIQVPQEHPRYSDCRLIAGEAATRLSRFQDAIAYYQTVPESNLKAQVTAGLAVAEILLHLGRVSEAVTSFEGVLLLSPRNPAATVRLAYIHGAVGQRWKAGKYYFQRLLNDQSTLQELILMGDLERPHEQEEFLKRCAESEPGDPLVRLGLAAFAVADGDLESGRQQLETLLADHPELVSAQSLLGEVLLNEKPESFCRWHSSLPTAGDDDPDIWLLRGLWFRRHGDSESSIGCFRRTLEIAPTHRRATYQLSQLLTNIGHVSAAEFSRQAQNLINLTQALDDVLRTRGRDEQMIERTVSILRSAGRLWEARAWSIAAIRTFPQAKWAIETVREIEQTLSASDPQVISSSNLALRISATEFRISNDFPCVQTADVPDSHVESSSSAAVIRFDDEAAAARLLFEYNNGDFDRASPGSRMFEQTGGGVGVIDFDGDEYPDLYFPQGGEWPEGSDLPAANSNFHDELFRNIHGLHFVAASGFAGISQFGFGQGCAVGDFNGDGFQDLYVANIGHNRLMQNNGDGTFTDVTHDAGLSESRWTTSCLIADLNADGIPDLFDVNYVDGPDVFRLLCQGYGCSPKNFQGVPDRLSIGRGDGTFVPQADVTPAQDSKGMGILTLRSKEPGQLDLFITNDQVPNFYLKAGRAEDSQEIRFRQEAFTTGLAFNEDGLSMACMGIACGDANRDELPDVFVTNFRNEANTLYIQDASGLFTDSTRASGMMAASLPYVGWGTQFLDADLDGDEDLVLVNGDVDDYRNSGGAYQMPSQFFLNTGIGLFTLLNSDGMGTYFQKLYLGRGLAVLDWNVDGRPDFAVSNINQPASLATNRSTSIGQSLRVTLTGRNGARDAIGSEVAVRSRQYSARQQLCAGNGLMASNERRLNFCFDTQIQSLQLTVDWTSGLHQDFDAVPAGCAVRIVEERSDLYLIPK